MIFRGQDEKRIHHRLEKIGGEKLQQALANRGIVDADPKEIAQALSGKGRGWPASKYKQVVAALQDVGVAQHAKSASSMVLKASRNAQQELDGPHLTPEQIKARMKVLARERREEANAEEENAGRMGILDRMRGSQGRANKIDKAAQEGALLDALPETSTGSTVRSIREELRKDLGLQPKIALPKPKKEDDFGSDFQA